MRFSEQQAAAFGIALNEATLLGVEVDPELRRAVITLLPLAAAGAAATEADPRVQLVLQPVGRVAASLRHGHWDDPNAMEEPMELEQLEGAVADFGGETIYGWEFLDVPDEDGFEGWQDRLSLDWACGDDGLDHTLDLSQARGIARHLDLRLWFDDLQILDADEREIPFKTFIRAAAQSWEERHGADPRSLG